MAKKPVMTRDDAGPKGTMSPVGLKSAAGQFGLKKGISIPPSSMTEEEKAKIEKEMAPEIKEAETIPEIEEEVPEAAKPTMNVPEGEEKGIEDIEESFECPVCHKEFSKKIALIGHMRSHKPKKINKK